ncbi:MAG TPA: hypothetical protein VFR62_10815 [Gemmatimonadales bacterium]|nr:hypothetical protein [Gemmatimonadales bacterium]
MADVWTSLAIKTPAEARPDLAGLGPHETVQRFQEFLDECLSGARPRSSVQVVPNGAQGTASITLASCPAGQVIEINGVNFTAIATTGTVAHNTFDQSGDDTADAAALAAAINACTDLRISGVLTASSALGVVTLTAARAGYGGNAIRVRNLGILATAVVTAAAVQAADTITINGTDLTATQSHATGTLTLSSCAVGATAVVNGVTFTAVASGEDGLTTFSQAGTDTQDAASLVTAINANPSLAGVVTATNAAGVVTVRAVAAGTGGNAITLVVTGSGLSRSGATLANGAAVANNQFCFTGSNTQVAADIVRAIGASSTALISSHVTARNTAAAVTITAIHPGLTGNMNTIATSDGTRLAITGSAARLAGATVASYQGAQATGTITIASGSGNYTATINGQATGNVAYNTSDDQTATDLAAAINALSQTAVVDHVKASAATNVVTITALQGGIQGNHITLAGTGTGTTVSGDRLTGGAVPTVVVASDAVTGGSSDTPITTTFP